MEIQEKLTSTHTFSELLQIAERAEADVSFWGTRFVSVAGYEGTLDIDALAARTLELLRLMNYEFEEAERQPGKRLAARIDRLYDDCAAKFRQANWYTKSIGAIRIITYHIYLLIFNRGRSVHSSWTDSFSGPNKDFEFYTPNQFINRFGITPEEAPSHGFDFAESEGPPVRMRISPDCFAMRRLRGEL